MKTITVPQVNKNSTFVTKFPFQFESTLDCNDYNSYIILQWLYIYESFKH